MFISVTGITYICAMDNECSLLLKGFVMVFAHIFAMVIECSLF